MIENGFKGTLVSYTLPSVMVLASLLSTTALTSAMRKWVSLLRSTPSAWSRVSHSPSTSHSTRSAAVASSARISR